MTTLILEGPSSYGLSHWSDPCARRAELKKNDYRPALSGKPALDIGTVFHTYLAAWYKKGNRFQASKVTLSPEPPKEIKQEGLRLFLHYRATFKKPNHFGKIIAAERVLEITVAGCKVQIKPDLEVRNEKKFLLGGVSYEPGVYLIDHKAVSSISPTGQEYYRAHFRACLYPYVYYKARGFAQRPMGFITSLTSKEESPNHAFVFTPFGTHEEARAATWCSNLQYKPDTNSAVCVEYVNGELQRCSFLNRQCFGY